MPRTTPLLAALAMLSGLSCAHAQQDDPSNAPVLNDKCRVAPGDTSDDSAKTPPQPASDSLTKTLADCNGVLKPAPTGDSEIAKPAPAQGETPVIKPHDLPQQQ